MSALFLYPADDPAPQILIDAVDRVIAGDRVGARDLLLRLDSDAAWRRRREAALEVRHIPRLRGNGPKVRQPRHGECKSTWERDRYHCRYCGGRTFDWNIFRMLGHAFPDVFPYQRNWAHGRCHQAIWLYAVSIEHRVARTVGGTNEPDNLLTACYFHQHIRNSRDLAILGWPVLPIQHESTWDGLANRVPLLRAAVAAHSGVPLVSVPRSILSVRSAFGTASQSDLTVGAWLKARILNQKCRYDFVIVGIDADCVQLARFWRERGVWKHSRKPVACLIHELFDCELIAQRAPTYGAAV